MMVSKCYIRSVKEIGCYWEKIINELKIGNNVSTFYALTFRDHFHARFLEISLNMQDITIKKVKLQYQEWRKTLIKKTYV